MNYETEFSNLVPVFTQYISRQMLDFLIAPGDSASRFADVVEESANLQNLPLPKIYRLDRAKSKLMYEESFYNPIAVIAPILLIAASDNTEKVLRINILEDYSVTGGKVNCIDRCLRSSPGGNFYSFFYHIMVSGRPIPRNNVYTHIVDSKFADYCDSKYNSKASPV